MPHCFTVQTTYTVAATKLPYNANGANMAAPTERNYYINSEFNTDDPTTCWSMYMKHY